jgi:hypothetical protein
MLTNEIREFYGISPVNDAWRKLQVKGLYNGFIFVDDQNVIRKQIRIDSGADFFYQEIDYEIQLSEDLRIIGKRGKDNPLTYASISKIKPVNKYLSISKVILELRNLKNGIELFSEYNHNWKSVTDAIKFLEEKMLYPTAFDSEQIAEYLHRKKAVNQKVRSGDIFRIKLSKGKFGYGRVIADLSKFTRYDTGIVSEWPVDIRGRCLFNDIIVSLAWVDYFLVVSDNPYLTYDNLKQYRTTPSVLVSDLYITHETYKIVGRCEIDTSSFDVPMGLDTYYQYAPICHIFKWGGCVVTFKPDEYIAKTGVPVRPEKYKTNMAAGNFPLEIFIQSSIEGKTDFSYLSRADLRESFFLKLRKIISKNLEFDIDSGDYDGFANKYGFMTKSDILAFTTE